MSYVPTAIVASLLCRAHTTNHTTTHNHIALQIIMWSHGGKGRQFLLRLEAGNNSSHLWISTRPLPATPTLSLSFPRSLSLPLPVSAAIYHVDCNCNFNCLTRAVGLVSGITFNAYCSDQPSTLDRLFCCCIKHSITYLLSAADSLRDSSLLSLSLSLRVRHWDMHLFAPQQSLWRRHEVTYCSSRLLTHSNMGLGLVIFHPPSDKNDFHLVKRSVSSGLVELFYVKEGFFKLQFSFGSFLFTLLHLAFIAGVYLLFHHQLWSLFIIGKYWNTPAMALVRVSSCLSLSPLRLEHGHGYTLTQTHFLACPRPWAHMNVDTLLYCVFDKTKKKVDPVTLSNSSCHPFCPIHQQPSCTSTSQALELQWEVTDCGRTMHSTLNFLSDFFWCWPRPVLEL